MYSAARPWILRHPSHVQEPPKRGKRDLLKDIERKYQRQWAQDKVFEISAPSSGVLNEQPWADKCMIEAPPCQ